MNHNNFIFFEDNEINSIEWLKDSTILVLNLKKDNLFTSNALGIDEFNLVKDLLNQYNLECDVHVTEWNLLGRDDFKTYGDNCYKASYIIKNIIDNLDDMSSLGYWTFTDYIETLNYSPTKVGGFKV